MQKYDEANKIYINMRADSQTYRLAPYNYLDQLWLPGLVAANADMLTADFPKLASRHANAAKSLRVIRGLRKNPAIAGFTIRKEVHTAHDLDACFNIPILRAYTQRRIGMASLSVGTCGDVEGVVFAGWLDKEHQRSGIGKQVGSMLLDKAVDFATTHSLYTIMTVVRPDNIGSVRIVEGLGLDPYDVPQDYAAAFGDGVSSQRQLYVAPVNQLHGSTAPTT